MARFDRITVYQAMLDTGLVPLFYHSKPEVAGQVIQACLSGGARVVEFTNRGDQALNVFRQVIDSQPELIVGVGSVIDAPTAALFIAHGANFIVGPIFREEIARLCNRRKIAYLPGCGSVKEISDAEEMGAEIVKVFPGGQVGGPDFIKSTLGPMPWSKLMPTGGVDAVRESISQWIKAGAACVGMGSNLIRKEWVAAGEFNRIEEMTAQVLAWVKEARSG